MKRFVLVIIFLSGFTATVLAQAPPAKDERAPARIEGKVINALDGSPVCQSISPSEAGQFFQIRHLTN